MTRYAQGTPESVMQATDAQMYGTKKDKTAPLPKITPQMKRAINKQPTKQQVMASRGGSPLRPTVMTAKGPAVMQKTMAKGGVVKAAAKKKK